MSSLVHRLFLCLTLLVSGTVMVHADSGYETDGGEYPLAGSLPGDQTMPDLSVGTGGGFLVWADNITDGSGLGISARQIDSSLSGSLSVFRVNSIGNGDQEKPKVKVLSGGGAAFVWQGGTVGSQQIYAAFLSSTNTWLNGTDTLVNTYTNGQHQDAALTTLTNGNVMVVYSSYGQDGSLQGVYGQRFSGAGAKLGIEFNISQTTTLNQRTPVVAGLSDGNFVVIWVSEKQLDEQHFDVSIYGRRFSPAGAALGNEFKINTGTNVCANPSVAALAGGGFGVAWGESDAAVADNGWDVVARVYSNAGTAVSSVRRLNTMQYGDQYGPKLATLGTDFLAVWTSLSQDGSWEGVYGQFMGSDSTLRGGEFRVNSTTVNKQMLPAVASTGGFHFLTVWASYVGGANSFDLYAQRYVSNLAPLNPPSAPVVSILSSSSLSVTWPAVQGLNVSNYSVYVNGNLTAAAVTTNNWFTHSNLSAGTQYYYTLDYVLTDGRRSPLSAPTTNTTYFPGTYGGIPFDWMSYYFNDNWPAAAADSDGDGVSNYNEFLAGTDPTNVNSVLRTWMVPTPQGMFLHWNTQPGFLYQPQQSVNLGPWSNLGGPCFASGTNFSVFVGNAPLGTYYRYRVGRMR